MSNDTSVYEIKLDNAEKALSCLRQLTEARAVFYDCLDNPEKKHCIMFIEGDSDGTWHATRENIDGYVLSARNKIKTLPQYSDESVLDKLLYQ